MSPGSSRLFAVLVAALAFGLYANTLGHDYCLDDHPLIVENPVTTAGLGALPTMLTREFQFQTRWGSGIYRPLTQASFALEWQLAPHRPALAHTTNALLYALTAAALWLTWRRVLAGYPALLAALATLLFVAHPVHTEVVANIKSRDEILALLGCTGALHLLWRHLESKGRAPLLGAALVYGLALFAKESAITWLAIIPLALWFFGGRTLGQTARLGALFLAPAGVFLAARALALGDTAVPTSALANFLVAAPDLGSRLATAVMVAGRYLWVLFVPHPLLSELGLGEVAPVTFSDTRVLASLAAYGGLLAAGLWGLRRRHLLSFAALYYLATFSVASNVLVVIGTAWGERLLFGPSLGFALAGGWALCKLAGVLDPTASSKPDPARWWRPAGAGLAWGVAGALVVVYGTLTVQRNPAWRDTYTLEQTDLAQSPRSAKLNLDVGTMESARARDPKEERVLDRALLESAIDHLSRSIAVTPIPEAYSERGLARLYLGQVDEAWADYAVALRELSRDVNVLTNVAKIYFLRRDLARAEEFYLRALALQPGFIPARRNLVHLFAMEKRFPEALDHAKRALEAAPDDAKMWVFAGLILLDMGDRPGARPYFIKALALDPSVKTPPF